MSVDGVIKGNQNTTKLLNELKKSVKQYPCLNKKEEEELIEKYKNDRETLNKLLFMHNIKLVFNQAKKYISKVDDFDTLVQDGMIGLGEACQRFDTSKGIKFITYAMPWIRKYILMHFYNKNAEFEKNQVSIDSPTLINNSKSGAGNETTFENYIDEYCEPTCDRPKTATEMLSANEQSEICRKLYNIMERDSSLSSVDKAVFTDMFYNHEKTRDIAEKYKIEMTDVNEIKHRILEKMHNVLVNKFNIKQFSDVWSA